MTPLEIAGRAVADEWTRIFPGSRPTEEHRIRLARAALMALAEADLGAFDKAVTGPSAMRTDASDRAGIFRVLLRSIANEGKTDG